MRTEILQQRYTDLLNQLQSVEHNIIMLRGELKWEPSAPANLFDQYDGAISDRSHLEEELYDVTLQMRNQHQLDRLAGGSNKVIHFPRRAVPRRQVH